MTLSNSPEPSSYRQSIILSYFSILLFWGGVYIYMPILAPYSKMVSGSLQSVGVVMGAYGLSQLLLRIPLGIWSDRWRRRKPFILLGFIFDGLAALGLILSHNTVMLFFSVLTAGIASSMWVPFTVLFSSYFALGQIAHSVSLILFFTRLAQIITNYACGTIAEAWGWVAPFYAGMILSFMGLLLSLGMAERRPEKNLAAPYRQFSFVVRNPTLLLASFFCSLFLFANSSTSFGFTPIFAQQIGASKKDLGVLFFWYMLPNTLATLLSGTYIRRLFSERVIISAGFLLVSGTIFFIPLVNRLVILYTLQAFNGIGIGLLFPLLMGLAIQSAAPDQQGTAMGFFASLYAAGMTLGPIISGVIAQRWGLSSVFILNGFLCLFGAFFAFIKIPSAWRKES